MPAHGGVHRDDDARQTDKRACERSRQSEDQGSARDEYDAGDDCGRAHDTVSGVYDHGGRSID